MGIKVLENRLFYLSTKNTAYGFVVSDRGLLRHLYFGKTVARAEDFLCLPEVEGSNLHSCADRTMEEFSSFGMQRYQETAMKVRFEDGTKDFRCRVAGHTVRGSALTVVLEDVQEPFAVELCYEVFEEADVIRRSARAVNRGSAPVVLERFYSAELGIADEDLKSVNFNGAWAAEFQQRADSLRGGKKVYENLRGTTGHVVNPCFIVHKNASEDAGEVFFGALAHSGNYKVVAEAAPYGFTNVLIGMSDTDFCQTLAGGESFETPAAYLGYTDQGFAEMSHIMHSFCIRELAPKAFAAKPLPVLYNSWCATVFDVACEQQKQLAKKAAGLGVELFVVDDGWFGTRDDDRQALGDWEVDARKFPNGLDELISYVNDLGMAFGLWIEPEMVNENSGLYRKHPDWIYRFPNREPLTDRHQLALDLTKEEVVQFMTETLDQLLSQHNIAYIKWDMNRYLSETGARGGIPEAQKEVWTKHVGNLYRVIRTVRERHPRVEFEACASGGGRIDLGILRYFDEFWTSDNTDALDRLKIQEGYSLLYPAKYMRAWVTDNGKKRKLPIAFRMHSAMCGALGIGSNLNTLAADEMEAIRAHIADYKRVRETVQFGDLYRLRSLRTDAFHCVQYVHEEKSVVFAFLVNQRFLQTKFTLKCKGLRENALYEIKHRDGAAVKSGAFLMRVGLDLRLAGDYDSQMIELKEISGEKGVSCHGQQG